MAASAVVAPSDKHARINTRRNWDGSPPSSSSGYSTPSSVHSRVSFASSKPGGAEELMAQLRRASHSRSSSSSGASGALSDLQQLVDTWAAGGMGLASTDGGSGERRVRDSARSSVSSLPNT